MELTLLMENLTVLSLPKGQNRKFLFKCSRWSSLRDLQNLVHELEGQNIKLRATEQAIDTSFGVRQGFPGYVGRIRRV